MPTTSIASADSRQMMNSALPMIYARTVRFHFATLIWQHSFGHNLALGRIGVIVVEENVCAGLESVDHHRRFRPGGEHLLLLQVAALEFHRPVALVADLDLETLSGRHLDP